MRVTLATMMAAAGVSQRTRQAHMRHTDPRLTDNTYTDERLLPVAAEITGLPAIIDEPEAETIPLVRTGTDYCAPNAHQKSGIHRQDAANTGKMGTSGRDPSETLQPVANTIVDSCRHGVASTGKTAGDETRTHDIHVGNVTLYH